MGGEVMPKGMATQSQLADASARDQGGAGTDVVAIITGVH
jgi:hypothetical protein